MPESARDPTHDGPTDIALAIRTNEVLWWNPGEEFPSLGIGHFIWYPAGVDGPFIESFPRLLAFLSARQETIATLSALPAEAWLLTGEHAFFAVYIVFSHSEALPEYLRVQSNFYIAWFPCSLI